ncbi:right-handed parallel beta-helix repeat-containing protein [Mucilaginibacter lappiensis]|uniref:Right handed beta helix region n=1 Tax=Mucilaginibacter lappiensis TaxID=354630 RepID=A0A841J9Q5_9SPHI|nr:right-handed parallel beta-helix repeat-containing protein [Mucilaginibacter lappiensis]MBB6126326.1 hypothetical protein [Mucilaginibacter lappiensis]
MKKIWEVSTLLMKFAMLTVILPIASCNKNQLVDKKSSAGTHLSDTNLGKADSTLTVYYVDGKNGNNANDGKSLAKAWKTIQKSCNSATPGSTVAILGGVYNEHVTVNVSGLSGKPINFVNYANQSVTIDGSGKAGNVILKIVDKSYLNFRGLTIKNLTMNEAQGILVDATENGGVTALSFKHIVVSQINWSTSAAAIPNADQNAQAFIVYGEGTTQANAVTKLVIDSCEISNNILGQSEAISLDGNIDGFSITHCLVHDNTNIGIDAIGNYGTSGTPQFDQARNGLISQNTCYKDFATYSTSGGIYVDGGRDIKIERNLSYQNGFGIEVGNEQNGSASNITVVSNLLYSNDDAGLAFGGYDEKTTGQVLNCSFYNNTFYSNDMGMNGNGEVLITKATNCKMENNIFYTGSQALLFSLTPITPQQNNTFNFNCYYSPDGNQNNVSVNWLKKEYDSFAAYKANTKQDGKSLYTNPNFKNLTASSPDFHLTALSTFTKSGDISVITDPTQTDYDGIPLISGGTTTMGAFQLH